MANKFESMISNLNVTKNLDQILPGAKYLGTGSHDVKITAVDSSMFDRGSVDIVFEDSESRTHKEKIFLYDMKDDSKFSIATRKILAATIPDTEAFGALLAELARGNKEAFGLLTTSKLNITIGDGNGWLAHSDGSERFVAKDVKTGNVVAGPCVTIDELKTEAGAKDLKRSFRRLFDAKATHADANVSAFNARISSRKSAATGNGGIGGSVSGAAADTGGIS